MASGPPTANPISPTNLSSPAARLTPAQLLIPTSNLYSVPEDSLVPISSQVHHGLFAKERSLLDWKYHKIPTRERQLLQDEIIESVLKRVVKECEQAQSSPRDEVTRTDVLQHQGNPQSRSTRHDFAEIQKDKPLVLFTAGGMGAGKGHTLRYFLSNRLIRLNKNFVWVDPDALARSLPERDQYLKANPKNASRLLHPEASLLQEILSNVAKSQRRSLVIDGSLSDCGWFGNMMKDYQAAGYDCEILFVFASERKMNERAIKRAETTGRYTDPESIRSSRQKSPICVSRLAKKSLIKRLRLVDNSEDGAPPRLVYDSHRDPVWNSQGSDGAVESNERIDVLGFVEGRFHQGEDGRILATAMDDKRNNIENAEIHHGERRYSSAGLEKDGKL